MGKSAYGNLGQRHDDDDDDDGDDDDDDDDDEDHCARCRAGVAIPVIGCSGSDLGQGVLLVKIWAEDFADFFQKLPKLQFGF